MSSSNTFKKDAHFFGLDLILHADLTMHKNIMRIKNGLALENIKSQLTKVGVSDVRDFNTSLDTEARMSLETLNERLGNTRFENPLLEQTGAERVL